MAIQTPEPESTHPPIEHIDYHAAEGLDAPAPLGDPPAWREWMMIAIGLVGLVAVLGIVVSVFAFASSGSAEKTTIVKRTGAPAAGADAPAKAPTLSDAKGVGLRSSPRSTRPCRRCPPAA